MKQIFMVNEKAGKQGVVNMAILSDKMKAVIQDVTEQCIKTYGLDIPEDDIDTIAAKLGGVVIHSDKLSRFQDARLFKYNASSKKDPDFIIVVPAALPEKQIRMMAAQELGHVFLHMKYLDKEAWKDIPEGYMYKTNNVDKEETKEFARSLLMPEEKYFNALKEHTFSDKFVHTEKLAEYFKVPDYEVVTRGLALQAIIREPKYNVSEQYR